MTRALHGTGEVVDFEYGYGPGFMVRADTAAQIVAGLAEEGWWRLGDKVVTVDHAIAAFYAAAADQGRTVIGGIGQAIIHHRLSAAYRVRARCLHDATPAHAEIRMSIERLVNEYRARNHPRHREAACWHDAVSDPDEGRPSGLRGLPSDGGVGSLAGPR